MPHFTSNFISYTLHRSIGINVIIPGLTSTETDMAINPKPSHKPKFPYPVVYLLHGYCNDYSTWERYTSIERYAEEQQIAVVTFSGENNFYVDTGNFIKSNFNTYPNYERLIDEIIDFVEGVFPVSNKAEDRYIAGLSMGGYGAMLNGFKNYKKFKAVGAFSPACTIFRKNMKSYNKKATAEDYEPINLLLKDKLNMPAFYIAYGSTDFLKDEIEQFIKAMDDNCIKYQCDYMEGYGHEWAFWDIQVNKFLKWLPRSDGYKDTAGRNI